MATTRRIKDALRNGLKPFANFVFAFLPPIYNPIIKQAFYSKKWPNLKEPKRYNEKLLAYMNSDYIEGLYKYVDKLEVRKYVESTIGSEYLTQVFKVFDNVEDIDVKELPERFYLKFNHGCGGHLACNSKELFIRELALKKEYLNKKLQEDYSRKMGERQYHRIVPKLYAEEFLDINFPKGALYRLFTFAGKVVFIKVEGDLHNGDYLYNYYNCQWDKLDKSVGYQGTVYELPKPDNLELLIDLAEKLAKPFPFVRVDLYSFSGRIIFSELTFTPSAAKVPVLPIEWDYELGNLFPYPFDKLKE